MLDVWYSIDPPALPCCLDAEETRRRDRFVFGGDRRAFTQAHSLKRLVLSCYEPGVAPCDWRFRTAHSGKPAVVQPIPYRFNISHSGRSVAMAVAGAEVGVDIERRRSVPHMDALAESVFHPEERRWLRRQPSVETGFFRLWTRKEALLKAAGVGLSHSPALFCCHGLDDDGGATAWVAGSRWRCFSRDLGEFALGFAVPYDFPVSDVRHLCVEPTPARYAAAPVLPALNELSRYVRVVA